jgi:hypothetical protein
LLLTWFEDVLSIWKCLRELILIVVLFDHGLELFHRVVFVKAFVELLCVASPYRCIVLYVSQNRLEVAHHFFVDVLYQLFLQRLLEQRSEAVDHGLDEKALNHSLFEDEGVKEPLVAVGKLVEAQLVSLFVFHLLDQPRARNAVFIDIFMFEVVRVLDKGPVLELFVLVISDEPVKELEEVL